MIKLKEFSQPVVSLAKAGTLVLLLITQLSCISTEYDITTHQQEYYVVSTVKEMEMGRKISRAINQELKVSHYPVDLDKINLIGNRLAKVCDRQELSYYFNLILEDDINAFALPGGYIYLYKGLYDSLETDDEIAFVLAHEIAHIVARHSVKRMQASWGANLLLLGTTQVKSNGNISAAAGVMTILNTIFSGYSQADEIIADSLAVKYTSAAGYDAKVGIKVMRTLEEKSRDIIRQQAYFRSHPFIAQRIRNIKEKLSIPLDLGDVVNN